MIRPGWRDPGRPTNEGMESLMVKEKVQEIRAAELVKGAVVRFGAGDWTVERVGTEGGMVAVTYTSAPIPVLYAPDAPVEVVDEPYRVVLTYEYANGPTVAESRPRTKDQAMRLFEWHIGFGGITPDSHVRARVMTDREYRRLGAEGHFTRRHVVEGPAL